MIVVALELIAINLRVGETIGIAQACSNRVGVTTVVPVDISFSWSLEAGRCFIRLEV